MGTADPVIGMIGMLIVDISGERLFITCRLAVFDTEPGFALVQEWKEFGSPWEMR